MSSDWKDGFLFLGNELVLDFVNTRPVDNGQPAELLPDFQALLRWCQAAGVITPSQATHLKKRAAARADHFTEAVRDLRERLRRELLAWEQGAPLHRTTLDELNRILAAHPLRTRIESAHGSLVREPWFEIGDLDDLLGPIADSAAKLFTEAPRARVRKCDRCVLHFHDVSKKGTRRWCSMNLCGNREKVAAYTARQKHP